MPIVPADRLSKIEFYEAHLAPWTANAADIGLAPSAVTALGVRIASARKAYDEHVAAAAAARAATQAFYDSVRAMHNAPGAGADMIQTIKTYAQTTSDPNVYVLAQIPPPATPGSTPPPGTPFDFTVRLLQNGALELKWKCNNPSGTSGTIYEVSRRLGGSTSGPFEYVGPTGVKTIIDDTVPSNSGPITYKITAIRSTQRGNPAQFTVTFGMGGGGLTVTGVTGAEGVNASKLAA
jgi:hypothetical protein